MSPLDGSAIFLQRFHLSNALCMSLVNALNQKPSGSLLIFWKSHKHDFTLMLTMGVFRGSCSPPQDCQILRDFSRSCHSRKVTHKEVRMKTQHRAIFVGLRSNLRLFSHHIVFNLYHELLCNFTKMNVFTHLH